MRCLVADSGLPNLVWGQLMQTAVHLSNRVLHAALENITPYRALDGKDANLGHLRAIGARAFVHVETHTRKLDLKTWEGRLAGTAWTGSHSASQIQPKGIRNVIFIETPPTLPDPAPASGLTDGEFTYEENDDLQRDVMDYTSYLDLDSPTYHGTVAPSALDTDEMWQLVNNIREITGPDLLVNTTSPASPVGGSDREVSSSDDAPSPDTGDAPAPAPASAPAPAPAAGRTKRFTRSTPTIDEPSSTNQRARNTSVNAKTVNELKRLALYTKSPLTDMGHCEKYLKFLEYAYIAYNHSRSEGEKVKTIPNTFKEAMRLPEATMWKAASDKEMKSLQNLKVYTLVPRSEVPPGQKGIGSKWVYKVKPDNMHKVRLVAKGWNQVPGRDHGGTFAPVSRLQSIRMVLAIAAEMNWEVVQLDVKTAFLYVDIEEDVFVDLAPGYETANRKGVQLVMKLGKSLYGLAHSLQNW